MASSKLITDTFPKTKKDRPINQKLHQTKTKDVSLKGESAVGFLICCTMELQRIQTFKFASVSNVQNYESGIMHDSF